jgi:hypothetical protein
VQLKKAEAKAKAEAEEGYRDQGKVLQGAIEEG